MKERWFNYRPLCLVFGFLLLGSVFSFYAPKNTVLTIITTISIAVALTIIAILKKKPQYVLVPVIAFGVGLGLYNLAVFNFNKSVDYTPSSIQARIYNIVDEYDGMIKVEADSLKFDDKKINDNIIIYIYDNDGLFENIEIGSLIEFEPYRFYKSDLFYYDTPSSSLYEDDLKYTTSAFMINVKHISTDKTFAEAIRERVKDNLELGLTNENAEIAYSALFGDKDLLSDKQYSVYKLSGVAHLLAVSGLHVGIIVGILNLIFKKLKVKGWLKFFVTAVFLMLYMYICDYSVSIIRATIMSLILLLSQILHKQYDSFNSISVAGIVIFLINPFCVFDVAFLLSFSCVIGITMLYRPIRRALAKTHMNAKIRDAAAISLATSIAIVMIMAFYFRTLNVISLIANVILIPIFTVAFSIVFVVSIVSIPFSIVSYVLMPVDYIFNLINLIATTLGNLSISNFNTIEFNYIAIIIYFVLLLFISRFCTAKYQYKIVSALPIVALLFYCLI